MSDNPLVNLEGITKPVSDLGIALIEKIASAGYILYEPIHKKRIAKAEAKIELIQAESEIEIDNLKRRTARRLIEEETRYQKNMEDITAKAVNQLNDDADPNAIDDDWIIKFFDKSRLITDDKVQDLWASILAGEANSAGSYSPKTLTTLADMNQRSLTLFNTFCSLCLVNLDNPRLLLASPPILKIRDARVPIIKGDFFKETMTFGQPIGEQSLKEIAQRCKSIYKGYFFGFKEFQLLSEHGLIENTTTMEYNCFWYNNELWGILKPSSYPPPTQEDYKEITITGYALTSVGKELFHITKRSNLPGYFEKIAEFLKVYYDVNIVHLPKR